MHRQWLCSQLLWTAGKAVIIPSLCRWGRPLLPGCRSTSGSSGWMPAMLGSQMLVGRMLR